MNKKINFEGYLVFVDIPSRRYPNEQKRYYMREHKPYTITDIEDMAKIYTRKSDAVKAAKWLCENIRPNFTYASFTNGFDFQSKDKQAGVIYKKIIETREETFV